MSEWETFCDASYYHLWRVRRKSERNFNDGFHVQDGKEATALVELLNRLERERDEAVEKIKLAEYWTWKANQRLDAATRERDDALKESLYYKTRYELLKDSREAIQ